jgi:uncharacterized protein with NRDE domain
MCLIFIAWRQHRRYPLVVAANRDEFYGRPTEPAAFWEESPEVLAGRDLEGGGTWLGFTRSGRFAALTNFRAGDFRLADAPTRGRLVSDFLQSRALPANYLTELEQRAASYNGFNLLLADGATLHWYSNRGGAPRALGPGLYGISNHLLDTPWPKVARGKQALGEIMEGDSIDAEAVLALLGDDHNAADTDLPDTGVGREWERVLSSMFITSESYGTRSSTVLLVEGSGHAAFTERSHEPGSPGAGTVTYELQLAGEPGNSGGIARSA